ncbi:hypothetical protein AB0J84_31330 [Micromonospora arborensis]|uniref:hypothetical protein n=1 Tax=Micromonospora arborensis TaxID=2116518 RepID=UPI00341CB468
MSEIPLDRYGRIVAGENEGYLVHVHFDAEVTGGYYVYLVDDLESPSDGGDYWAKDREELTNLVRLMEWRVEWLEEECHSS